MIRLAREFRLVPVVLIATSCLLALKLLGLLVDGGYIFSGRENAANENRVRVVAGDRVIESVPIPKPELPRSEKSWAQDNFGFPGRPKPTDPSALPDITGSVQAKPKEAPPPGDAAATKPKPQEPKPDPGGTVITADPRPLSPAERAILERLQERREELETRARELDMRETLVKAAEKKLEARLNELKEIEGRMKAASQGKAESDVARLKGLVTMYESMKAKDAAKIFDRLDMRVLMEVASQINPRRMSDILAQMSPETAERLTVEFANRAGGEKASAAPAELPKIEGKPNG